MQTIKCELCGSTSFTKQDGTFICEQCGTKFSLEEAKKMMAEDASAGANDTIKNYLDLSKSAYEAGNGKSAFDYANKALELDPKNVDAWLSKMVSIEHIGTIGDPKLLEVVEAGKNAISFSGNNKDVENKVFSYYLSRALDLLTLATIKLSDIDSLKKSYRTFCVISILTADRNCRDADNGIVQLYENIAIESIALTAYVPDEALKENPELAKKLLQCAKQYKRETDALIERFKVYNAKLIPSAIEQRNNSAIAMYNRASAVLSESDPSFSNNESTHIQTPQDSGGCYIATCVYGSYDCPEVWTLRRFRDFSLAQNCFGRAFIKTYYAISPTLVKWFGKYTWFKSMWKKPLDKWVEKLNFEGVDNTPYND